jgi:hypothetical protein
MQSALFKVCPYFFRNVQLMRLKKKMCIVFFMRVLKVKCVVK